MTPKSPPLHTVGQVHHHYKLIRITPIHELQCLVRELVHEPTGARILHIGNDDPENLFCLSFQTLPSDSTGVAHILEHTVLCGSKKFPIKDPFFAMSRRSLNTFMNALTGADFTCYPAATQVPKDFYNLLEVYLDAVFHPNLNEFSFQQEGHRLEFATSTDPTSPLEYKGIVFNEMKGALASSNARLVEAMNAALFPSLTYGYNSGGDPVDIPKLTYAQLKDFYQTYYHPSRCLFFFYGNMPLETHLDFIATHALNDAVKAAPLPPIPKQRRYTHPITETHSYPCPEGDLTNQTLISFGWLTSHILEQEITLALCILEIILLDNDASPLKLALMQSGWCKQVTSYIDIESSEIPWVIILRGCEESNADALEEVMRDCLENLCKHGIPLTSIENAIHQLEFYRSEISSDSGPFGLSLFMRSGLLMQHGADPIHALMIHSLFESLRKNVLADPHFFVDLIKKYLLDNKHFVRIVMKPDPNLEHEEAEREKSTLAKIKTSLSEKAQQDLVHKAQALAAFQKEQEEMDEDILPKVTLQDIPLHPKDYPLIQDKVGGLNVFHRQVFTNEIIYADLVYDLPDLKEEDLFYLRILMMVLAQMGCGSRSYTENLEYIQGNTGGISTSVNFNIQASDHLSFTPTLHLRGKALHRKTPKLFPLMLELLTSVKLDDPKRLKEILSKNFTALESRLNQSALRYAINVSSSGLSTSSKLSDDLYGLTFYTNLRDTLKNFDKKSHDLISKLKSIQQLIAAPHHPHLVLSCDNDSYVKMRSHGFYGLSDLESQPFSPWVGDYPLIRPKPQGRIISSPIAFIGQVFSTVSYTHPSASALSIAAFMFDHLTLHPKIREQGGAYGGGAVANPLSGNFYFYSYRDPHIVKTMQVFQEAIDLILEGDFEPSDLEDAKLEMIQSLDTPISPGSQAEVAYGWWREGRTMPIRQAFRNSVLNLQGQDVIDAVKNIIAPNLHKGVPVVFSGKEMLESANTQLKNMQQPTLSIEQI